MAAAPAGTELLAASTTTPPAPTTGPIRARSPMSPQRLTAQVTANVPTVQEPATSPVAAALHPRSCPASGTHRMTVGSTVAPRSVTAVSSGMTSCARAAVTEAQMPAATGVRAAGGSSRGGRTRSSTPSTRAYVTRSTPVASGRPPSPSSTPPSAGPLVRATWCSRLTEARARDSWSSSANSRGNTPSAGRRSAAAVPEATATRHSPSSVAPLVACTRNSSSTSTIAASHQSIVRRMPHRSATAPPSRISTHSGTDWRLRTRAAGPGPNSAAVQPRAKYVTESPRVDSAAASDQVRNGVMPARASA